MPDTRLASLLLSLALLFLLPAAPLSQDAKEQLAVLEFEVIGSGPEQGSVLTNQLRSELLKTGRFTMVNRAQLDRILEELALQQQLCTEQACAVEVGKLLGVRRIVTGSVTKVTDTLWQVSATLTRVDTAEILRQEVINHAGDFASLFLSGMATMAQRLAATDAEVIAGATRLTPESIAPSVYDAIRGVLVTGIAFSEDSGRLYYGTGESVKRWNIVERRELAPAIESSEGDVTALAVNRTGRLLAIGTDDGAVMLADADSGRIIHTESVHSDAVTTLAFSPADNFFASGGEDETVHVFHVRTGGHAFALKGPDEPVATVRFADNGRQLIVAAKDRTVRVFDVNVQREVRAFQESAQRLLVADLSRNGGYLAIAAKVIQIDLRRNRRLDTELIKIRDVGTGEELAAFEAHDKAIRSVAFFPDPRYLATGSSDGRIKIWDLQSKAAIATLPLQGAVTALTTSPNGKWLAGADDSKVLTLWEVTR